MLVSVSASPSVTPHPYSETICGVVVLWCCGVVVFKFMAHFGKLSRAILIVNYYC